MVDLHHPNVVVILTFPCSVSHRIVSNWEDKMKEKSSIISHAVFQTFGIQVPVLWLENDVDDLNELEKVGEFTLLPNMEKQPENLIKACQMVLKNSSDNYALYAFDRCFEKFDIKRQYRVDRHEILAKDTTTRHGAISEDEEDLLDILRGGPKDGKWSFIRSDSTASNYRFGFIIFLRFFEFIWKCT